MVNCPLQKSSGLCNGSITNSFNVSLTFSRAPISSKVTPMSLGGITSAKSLFSNSFSVTTSWFQKTQAGEWFRINKLINPPPLQTEYIQSSEVLTNYQMKLSPTNKQQKFTTITLRDFFRLFDSFWTACKIPIPCWMLV